MFFWGGEEELLKQIQVGIVFFCLLFFLFCFESLKHVI